MHVSTEAIFSKIFRYKENRLPYPRELLDMACYFEESETLDWQILNQAFDAKKEGFEAESAKSSAE